MTDIALDRPRAEFAALKGLMIAFGNISGAMRAGQDYARLERMSDFELEALGLSREELPELVLKRHMG